MTTAVRSEPLSIQKEWVGLDEDSSWLAAIDPKQVDILNALNRGSVPFQITLSGNPVEIRIARNLTPLLDPVELPIVIGPWMAKLVLSSGTLDRLFERLVVGKKASSLTPLQIAVLVEHALSQQLNDLEKIIEHPLGFCAAETPAGNEIQIPWIIDFHDFPRHAELHLSRSAAHALGLALEKSVAHRDLEFLSVIPFPIQLCAGTQEITVSELRSLKAGDVVLRREPPETKLVALSSNRFIASAAQSGTGYVLAGPWQPLHTNREYSMTSQLQPKHAEKTDPFDRIDDLPVQLVFEIGRSELPLSELRQLGEGSILPTATGTGGSVNIMANGRLIGNGELVKIGVGLGVRVLRLSTNG